MNSSDVVETVREDAKTELSRLGSSKSLYADTGGELTSETVLSALADATHHAGETVADWAEADGVFTDAADRLRDQHDRLVAELDEDEPGESPAIVAALATADETAERLGALVGWTLVAERKASQATGYFTGQADPQTASLIREFGDDYEAIRETGLDALDDVDAEELQRAAEAALRIVETAYDEYFETLESLGVNPKPVC